ncbi:MAG: hypothetical protein KJ950_00205 [Proteobacteria bacterium]|nr:hypothetical protein [Pseudomonadota bacterium]MBU1687532.1 hypothetical protein [Pseudomonadota bacterium]
MAVIKSTMDMVMARAAQMAGEPSDDGGAEEASKEGMRAAAGFLRGEAIDLAGLIAGRPGADRSAFVQGLIGVLLRHIVLPREKEQLVGAELAMNGLVAAGAGHGELLPALAELKKILDRYIQHKEQIREQLEAAFAQQMEQVEGTLAQQTGMRMKLKPSQHPKFQEEWAKITEQLNGQYGQAVDQHKQLIEQILMAG